MTKVKDNGISQIMVTLPISFLFYVQHYQETSVIFLTQKLGVIVDTLKSHLTMQHLLLANL